jgi:hypothetical protein
MREGHEMRIALAPQYRFWMFALLPTTLGLGTAALWARSLNWPLSVDADGLILRYRRRVPWNSIKKISVWRSYHDGHVSRMDIHYRGGTSKIPLRGLQDSEKVARVILTSFEQSRCAHSTVIDSEKVANSRRPLDREYLHHHQPLRPRPLRQRLQARQ